MVLCVVVVCVVVILPCDVSVACIVMHGVYMSARSLVGYGNVLGYGVHRMVVLLFLWLLKHV